MKEQIDHLDKKILSALQQDARKPILEIARDLGVTRATVHSRINRLKENNIILGSKVVVDIKALGYGISAFVGIKLTDKASTHTVREVLESISEVVEIHATTGAYNMFVKVLVPDVPTLHDLLTSEMKIQGVQSTETFLILDTYLVKDLVL